MGWRVFNTSDAGCFMAQADCTTEQDQKVLQTYLEGKSAKIKAAKSKQQTFIVRIYFRDQQEISALNSIGNELT